MSNLNETAEQKRLNETRDQKVTWKDYILFHEYFHGDNGAGLGASHQTGWTGVSAKLIELFGRLDAQQFLDAGKAGAFAKGESKM